MVKNALQHTFLMSEMLAMAAFHLATTKTAQKDFYAHQAATLQSQALSEYRSIAANLTKATSEPSFLFSMILGHHVIFESLQRYSLGYNDYLNSIVRAIDLVRATRSVISGFWTTLRQSDLAPLLVDDAAVESAQASGQGVLDLSDLHALLELMSQDQVDGSSHSACSDAVERLRWLSSAMAVADAQSSAKEGDASSNLLLSWPITIPEEYSRLLHRQCPQALIILAHYAALLHQRGRSWTIGESPAYLVTTINAHLSPPWQQWLVRPIQRISQPVQQS